MRFVIISVCIIKGHGQLFVLIPEQYLNKFCFLACLLILQKETKGYVNKSAQHLEYEMLTTRTTSADSGKLLLASDV
jgi:hypothetical protein